MISFIKTDHRIKTCLKSTENSICLIIKNYQTNLLPPLDISCRFFYDGKNSHYNDIF